MINKSGVWYNKGNGNIQRGFSMMSQVSRKVIALLLYEFLISMIVERRAATEALDAIDRQLRVIGPSFMDEPCSLQKSLEATRLKAAEYRDEVWNQSHMAYERLKAYKDEIPDVGLFEPDFFDRLIH